MTDVLDMLKGDVAAVREKQRQREQLRESRRDANPECAALADQARRDFGRIKILRMESLITGEVWGGDPYANETFVPGSEIIAAADFQDRRKKK